MKKFYRNLGLVFLSVLTAACTCAAFSACSKKDEGDDSGADDYIEIPAESVAGKWDEYNGVKLAFVDEEAYNDGEIDESKVLPELNCKLGGKYYMVADFEIEAPYDNDGRESVTAALKIQPAAALSATIQDTNSGNVSNEVEGDLREIKATYKIPEKADSPRNMRLVIQFEAKKSGSASVNLSFESSCEMQGVKTAEIEKSAMLGYSDKLAFTVSDGTYAVTGKGDERGNAIIIPSIYNYSYVTAISAEAFSNISSNSLTVPSSITRVGYNAFSDSGIYNYELDGLKYLGNESNKRVILMGVADQYLTSASISDKTKVIYDYAFRESSVKSVVIPEGVISIGNSVFSGCKNITNISFPNSVKYFGNNALNISSLQCYEEGGLKYLGNQENKYVVLCGTIGNEEAYKINEKTKFICSSAFASCGYLTGVTIPDGVKSIGNYAFAYCSNLTSVVIPKSVSSINVSVFYGCSGLKNISVDKDNPAYTATEACLLSKDGKTLIMGFKNSKIPDGVTTIGENAFNSCSGLTEITIPDSIKVIGSSAFKGCSNLKSLTQSKNLTMIGDNAFAGCQSLTEITIPKSVTDIGAGAFGNCTKLTSITIPDSVNVIGNSAFSDCSGIKNIKISDGVGSIGSSAFENCTGLTDVTIPSSVTSIGGGAFRGCSGLKNIALGNGVTTIGDGAFGNCSSLSGISIPKSVSKIGYNVFYGCNSLSSISVDKGNSSFSSGGNCLLSKDGKTLILGCKSSSIPNGVTSISSSAFEKCTELTSITIPDSVTSIGNYAFSGCSGLTKATIGKGIGSIGESVFYNCTGLTSITIPSNVTIVGKSAFSGCSGLKSITLSSNTKSIGEYAFWNCSGVTSITIPKTVTQIGKEAFGRCIGLKTITFNDEKLRWNNMNRNNSFTSVQCTVRCTNGDITIG